MEIKNILIKLLDAYRNKKGSGYTNKLKALWGITIVTVNGKSNHIFRRNTNKILHIDELEELIGTKDPIFLDNQTIIKILQESLNKINSLEKENNQLKNWVLTDPSLDKEIKYSIVKGNKIQNSINGIPYDDPKPFSSKKPQPPKSRIVKDSMLSTYDDNAKGIINRIRGFFK